MTIETKFSRNDIVYILIGYEIKKAIISALYFSDHEFLEKHIHYDVVYIDENNNNSKTKGLSEDEIFNTPGELLEKLKNSIPTTNN